MDRNERIYQMAERVDDLCTTENFGQSYALAERLYDAYPHLRVAVAETESSRQYRAKRRSIDRKALRQLKHSVVFSETEVSHLRELQRRTSR